jgi:hypothetical protein
LYFDGSSGLIEPAQGQAGAVPHYNRVMTEHLSLGQFEAERASGPADGATGRDLRVARPGLLTNLILRLDDKLKRDRGVTEFAGCAESILCVAVVPADADVRLSDGTFVAADDPIIEIHFAHQRMPQASQGAGIGWGARFGRLLNISFRELAAAVDVDPRLKDAKALRARLAFASERNRGDARRFGVRFRLQTIEPPAPVSMARRVHDFGEDLWLVALTWVFNPGALKGRSVRRMREDLWMSRDQLIAHFGKPRVG